MPANRNKSVSSRNKEARQSSLFNGSLRPWVKWPGGKSGELPLIIENAPKTPIRRFIEPFVGGGSVLLAVNHLIPATANDICPELIELYKAGAENDLVVKSELLNIANGWDRIGVHREDVLSIAKTLVDNFSAPRSIADELFNHFHGDLQNLVPALIDEMERRFLQDLPKKLDRIQKLQIKHSRPLPLDEMIDNILGSVYAAFYMAVRRRYNNSRANHVHSKVRAADFFFLREFSYASMFRFNAKGEFNVPYGGISYNKKSFTSKVDSLFDPAMRSRLSNTEWHCSDFSIFFENIKPAHNDFVFVDPPYDSDFSDYDNREFALSDQRRLAELLESLASDVMIVIGDTPIIREIYSSSKWAIDENQKLYSWNIKGRNERNKTHLVITNYS
jgi:DNA adenine methylase